MGKVALISGISGQDGSLLAELLLERGYEVVGIVRRSPSERFENLEAVRARVELVQSDLLDQLALVDILRRVQPDEVYNLAAPSFVPLSWRQPVATAEFAAVGATALLEAVRTTAPEARVYQAASSEIFGDPLVAPQDETTPIMPVTPYGAAKAYAFFVTKSYRRLYGLHASSGILYNHESPRRPAEFLPRKVSLGVASIALGLNDRLVIGDLDARRDWGYAGDYVRAMWLMLQREEADDFVIASGTTHSVRDLVSCAFARVGLDWEQYTHVDQALIRGRAELHNLVGNTAKAEERLGWRPEVDFRSLVEMLVDADLEGLRSGRVRVDAGAVRRD